jgi:alpha-D-xyloside xylohydrolase
MEAAHKKGTPVMRPLFYDFPQDKAAWECEDAYMFGPELLVAPIMYEGITKREVYLPAGANWKNVWTGEILNGGSTVEVDAPLAIIPVFAKIADAEGTGTGTGEAGSSIADLWA